MKRLLTALMAVGCGSIPGSPEWLVDRPRLLAVAAEPPEVQQGSAATFRVLLAGPDGDIDASQAQWQPCTSPLPLTETGAVATACIDDQANAATGSAARLTMAFDACSRFGPIPSPDSQRPRVPDATGGYFQPVRVEAGGAIAFAEERLRCPLSQASFAVSQQFEHSYFVNLNPSVTSFSSSAPLDSIPAGAATTLSVSWPDSALETFPVVDPASLSLVTVRETMSVAWFATAGTLRDARTGSASTTASTVWTAPVQAATVHLWAVLRDSRGGVTWTSAAADVVPGPAQ